MAGTPLTGSDGVSLMDSAARSLPTIAVIGLGYVGLPLVIEFGKLTRTIGFDINTETVRACQAGHDPSREISNDAMLAAVHAEYSANPACLESADFIIIAVPTPVDQAHTPDFTPLIGASRSAGAHLKTGCIVVYESTVYPGATEEVCIPVLEEASGKKWQQDFNVGYSPERINPGDREHTLTTVLKIVSGDCPATLDKVANLYALIVKAGVHRVSSIKVAEAAKVIENTQRDLNIALMNELALIFNRLDIDTNEVIEAAGTKWNFLKFRPGLVGGHCIGVDPYYLTHKAQSIGYHPEVILAGRRINDNMGKYIAEQTIKQMIATGSPIKGAHVNILGLTFKENCADLRNTKVADMVRELQSYGVQTHVHDPWVEAEEARHEYGITLETREALKPADALVVAVAHREFSDLAQNFSGLLRQDGCLIDVKAVFDKAGIEAMKLHYWRL
jgi:UDP-N-acetyl-D-galactosamine dehydrogenase